MVYGRLLILFTFLIASMPAIAGQATYKDMRGKWESTKCTPPHTMAPSDLNSEAAADDLNSQVLQHNQFVTEATTYMECLAEEGNKDAQAVSYLVTESIKLIIEKMQTKINQSSLHIKKQQEEDASSFF